MEKTVRIIAKLDIKSSYVVKPVHFEGLRKIGDPALLAKAYYEQGADEIAYVDIVASLYQRPAQLAQIRRTAQDVFVPLAVGGGVRTLEDFSGLFHSGADKVLLNTFALQHNAGLIDEAAKQFGSQSVVVNIEAKKREGDWLCYTDCGRIDSGKQVLQWVKEAEERGAGEIFLQSVDTDGRRRGFDLELAAKVTQSVNIPVVVASGAGKLEDILRLAVEVEPSGIAISSVLHTKQLSIAEIKHALSLNKKEAQC